MKVLGPSSAAISKVECMPSASRNFIGKKKEKWHWSKGRIPWDLYKKENRWMMEKALAEGWRKRESLPPSLSREEDQRFVLCITMDIRSPILMSPGVWCSFHGLYSLWVHKWSLHGNQWVSFLPFYLTAQASALLKKHNCIKKEWNNKGIVLAALVRTSFLPWEFLLCISS